MTLKTLLSALALSICGTSFAQNPIRELPFRNEQTEVEPEMPANKTKTVSNVISLNGEVLSCCSGYTSRAGNISGVIKLKSDDGQLYSIILPPTESMNIPAGRIVTIRVSPLPEDGKYYMPPQTCAGLNGSTIVLLAYK